MNTTYHAVLHGTQIEWKDKVPSELLNGKDLEVLITVKEKDEDGDLDDATRGAMAADLLEKIAARGGIPSIADPVEWQREIREDREFYGRE